MHGPRRSLFAGGHVVATVLIVLAMITDACAPTPVSHGCDGPARDHVMLVDRLRCAGVRVDIGEPVTLPLLRAQGTTLVLTGAPVSGEARVESFSYDDTDLATDARMIVLEDVAKFAPDGSLREPGASIAYHGTPHLFRSDRVIAIYAGDDRAVLDLLTGLLGPQFAGR